MAVKVSFEIGHTAKLKSKKTPEGFTHDWELYVRGADKCDINHFVDKVVFTLHESFPKPKRTYKEAPYVLKESGYAGFILPIDIYFKNRERVTYSYDLELLNTGPPVHRSIVKKYVFNNPSEDFKQKLMKAGGIPLMINYDEKSRDSMDDRGQNMKSKLNIDVGKKHKGRPEDSKIQTFATLFGTPITKTSTKVSPDPKSKGSPSMSLNNKNNNKAIEKNLPVPSGSGKEKNEKNDKKDKHRRNSPHRERDSSKDDKKPLIEEKRDRKEEKIKEKSHSRDRDRSKDRILKRPGSPKRLPSPKRPSPLRSSAVAGRNDDKQQIKNEPDGKKSSSNSGKKSKKEKKSHEKDKDRERKERDRERKDKDERSNSSSSHISSTSTGFSNSGQIKNNVEVKTDFVKKEGQIKDVKEIKKSDMKLLEVPGMEKKQLDKHDKETEKKHKHKKKDKNKEKDKDKDILIKEKKKDKSNKQRDELKKIMQDSPQRNESLTIQQKSTLSNSSNKISDQDSSDSENDSSIRPPSETKSNNNLSDTSNSSFPDVVIQKAAIQHFEEIKPDKKEQKSREKSKIEKDSKKRKRKSKDDTEVVTRKSISPVVNLPPEPVGKLMKKDLDDKINSPKTSLSNHGSSQDASPHISNSSPIFRTPSAAPVPVSANNSNDRSSINVDYMSELRELQHKIMTLQDNNELQQVVEMIAATGRFEVTNKTFDFDLCALDRTTVQRLQDFLATTVS